ncbi:MAG: acyl-CoA dehydrogenase family protein [Deltaproteobacteria bacterium]|nr:acyl-CoA dehydrogenase family protein [Deltaproteobacteria bacterium]
MFLHLNPAQKEIQEKVRALVAEEITPHALEIDSRDEFPQTSYEAFIRAGLLKLSLPLEYGGRDTDTTSLCLVIEEISKASPASALLIFPTQAVIRIIRGVGTSEQQKRFFSDMAQGDRLCGFCLTEPNHGSDAGSLQTRAVLDGDCYRVNGTKTFITLGPHAHYYLVFVRTGPGKRTAGVSALIVPRETSGLSFGKKEKKMGLGGSVTSEMIFNQAKVDQENLLLQEGEGWSILSHHANIMRVWGVASMSLGIAEGAYEAALAFAKKRTQFKRLIASFQAISFMLADMKMEIEAARSMIFRTAAMIDNREGTFRDQETLVSMCKCYASDLAMRTTIDAVQIYGGAGYLKGSPVERMMRDAKAIQIFDGSNQIQRMIVAKNILLD